MDVTDCIAVSHTQESDNMTDFNEASARVNKAVGETTERIEKETAEFIKYLNDEVVPAVRQHSTKALRTAAEKLTEFANYMEKHSTTAPK
jgi:hypothetical protein